MRLALTGGGTGGHVFPAVEVGRLALDEGHEVRYYGSERGIEGKSAAAAGITFTAYPAEPIPRLLSPRGLRAAIQLLRSSSKAANDLSSWKPTVLFATGGYSSGPALRAARKLGIPIVLHEQNSIPGRATRMAGTTAAKVCIVFEETGRFFPLERVVRTGMPVRRELRAFAGHARVGGGFLTLITGGSQGARALNQLASGLVQSASRDGDGWLHIAGPKLVSEVEKRSSSHEIVDYLEASEMADALARSSLAICRAGSGFIAELALFGLPAIFLPLPTAFANHQLHNAKEIQSLGGGDVVEQEAATPEGLAELWSAWRDNADRRRLASEALLRWAVPDATERVFAVVKEVAR